MKAVILTAGKGTRLAPLTLSVPKGLVEVCGRPILSYTLDNLVGIVNEAILVVGHLGHKISEFFGSSYKGIKLVYVEQKELKGSGHALLCAKPYLSGKFVVLNGDDIYSRSDLEKLFVSEYGILTKKVEEPSSFGVVVCDEKGCMSRIVEKPKEFVSDLANVGVYVFDESIFEKELSLSPRGEYEIIEYLNFLVGSGKKVRVVSIFDYWFPVNNFEQLEVANTGLKGVVKSKR